MTTNEELDGVMGGNNTKSLEDRVKKLESDLERLQLMYSQHAHEIQRICETAMTEGRALSPPTTAYRVLNPLIVYCGDIKGVFKCEFDDPYEIQKLHIIELNKARGVYKKHKAEVKEAYEKAKKYRSGNYDDNLNSEGNVGSMVSF